MSNSTMDTHEYIDNNTFNYSALVTYMIEENTNDVGLYQLLLVLSISSDTPEKYILLVKMLLPNVTQRYL